MNVFIAGRTSNFPFVVIIGMGIAYADVCYGCSWTVKFYFLLSFRAFSLNYKWYRVNLKLINKRTKNALFLFDFNL